MSKNKIKIKKKKKDEELIQIQGGLSNMTAGCNT